MGSTKFKGKERKRKAPKAMKTYQRGRGGRSGVLPVFCVCVERKEEPGYPVRSLSGTVRCAKCYGKVRA